MRKEQQKRSIPTSRNVCLQCLYYCRNVNFDSWHDLILSSYFKTLVPSLTGNFKLTTSCTSPSLYWLS